MPTISHQYKVVIEVKEEAIQTLCLLGANLLAQTDHPEHFANRLVTLFAVQPGQEDIAL
jgi:hypothetical protein